MTEENRSFLASIDDLAQRLESVVADTAPVFDGIVQRRRRGEREIADEAFLGMLGVLLDVREYRNLLELALRVAPAEELHAIEGIATDMRRPTSPSLPRSLQGSPVWLPQALPRRRAVRTRQG